MYSVVNLELSIILNGSKQALPAYFSVLQKELICSVHHNATSDKKMATGTFTNSSE